MNLAGLTDDELRELRSAVDIEEDIRYQSIGPRLPRDFDRVPLTALEHGLEAYKDAVRERLNTDMVLLKILGT